MQKPTPFDSFRTYKKKDSFRGRPFSNADQTADFEDALFNLVTK
jgi:hypothetical protein